MKKILVNSKNKQIWIHFNNLFGYEEQDLRLLAANKKYDFIKSINHPEVEQILYIWIKNQKFDELMLQLVNEGIELKDVEISPSLIVFLHEVTNAKAGNQLVSQEVLEVTDEKGNTYDKWVSRKYSLPQEVHQWMHESYCNKNGLMYILMYDTHNETTQEINPKLINGITPEMDVKVPLSTISEDVNVQWAILHTMSYMIMKYLMFHDLLGIALKGAFAWTNETFHWPVKILYYTLQKIWYAHYFHPAAKDDASNSLSDEDDILTSNKNTNKNKNKEMNKASATEKLEYSISQHKVNWFRGMTLQTVTADVVFQPTLNMHEESNVWTLPLSCGWAMQSKSSMKGLNTKLSHVWKCGKQVDNTVTWENSMATWNAKRVCALPAKSTEDWENEVIEVQQIIANILSSVSCLWYTFDKVNTHAFKTGKSKEWCLKQFWKYERVKTCQWKNNCSIRGLCQLIFNNKDCGMHWRIRNEHQLNTILSIQYTTCAQFLKDRGFVVHDSGLQVVGDDWNVDELISSDDRDVDGKKQDKKEIDDENANIPLTNIYHENTNDPLPESSITKVSHTKQKHKNNISNITNNPINVISDDDFGYNNNDNVWNNNDNDSDLEILTPGQYNRNVKVENNNEMQFVTSKQSNSNSNKHPSNIVKKFNQSCLSRPNFVQKPNTNVYIQSNATNHNVLPNKTLATTCHNTNTLKRPTRIKAKTKTKQNRHNSNNNNQNVQYSSKLCGNKRNKVKSKSKNTHQNLSKRNKTNKQTNLSHVEDCSKMIRKHKRKLAPKSSVTMPKSNVVNHIAPPQNKRIKLTSRKNIANRRKSRNDDNQNQQDMNFNGYDGDTQDSDDNLMQF